MAEKEWRVQATGEDTTKVLTDVYYMTTKNKDNNKRTKDVVNGVKKLKIIEGNMQSINNVRPGGKYEIEAAKKAESSNKNVDTDRG